MQHYMSGESIIEEIKEDTSVELSEEDKEIATQIEDLLETRVRPSVASHGGDIVFHSYSEGIVELEMRGACSGCPSSTLTLKQGVQNLLCHYIFLIGVIPKRFKPFEIITPTDDKQEIIASIFSFDSDKT